MSTVPTGLPDGVADSPGPLGLVGGRLTGGAMGRRWTAFLNWADPIRAHDGVDPYALYAFAQHGRKALPGDGCPSVYAAVDLYDKCRYVGKSTDPYERFDAHARTMGRRDRWTYVLVCRLKDEARIYEAERMAAVFCEPIEGQRHPRRR